MYTQNSEKALQGLLRKYKVTQSEGLNFAPGYTFFNKEIVETDVPMQTWRFNRKFIELRKLVENQTVEHPSMFRFCAIADQVQWNLVSLMYREFDLCEFIGGSPVVSVQAVINQSAGSVIARLACGVICSIEVGANLHQSSEMIDRHEIIARRGVASDLVVDTQLPQSSVYTFCESGTNKYRDTDNELFDLSETETNYVRTVFELSKCPGLIPLSRERHMHLSTLVEAAIRSDKKYRKIDI